jgi:hypothetical protein
MPPSGAATFSFGGENDATPATPEQSRYRC